MVIQASPALRILHPPCPVLVSCPAFLSAVGSAVPGLPFRQPPLQPAARLAWGFPDTSQAMAQRKPANSRGGVLSFTLCQQTKGEHSHIDPSFCPTLFLSKEMFPDGVAG